jgi:LAO/AO transport system kinase
MTAAKKAAKAGKPQIDEMVAGVLKGNTRAIAKMMSRAEAGFEESRAAMAEIHRHAGNAHVIGITGVPGSGKSTLVRALAHQFRDADRRVGIVAIDPSSPFSGGAILGDRVRMADLATDDGTFVRSMATRGALGGLARACLDTVDIMDAAGFDVVVVETVGVGQDEVDIAEAAHTVVVVSAPGLGDEIQAIKAGVLEIADIHAVSKCDRPDSNQTASDLRAMLGLSLSGKQRHGWKVPVLSTSAQEGDGIAELAASIDEHRTHLEDSGEKSQRRRRILETRILKTAEDILLTRIHQEREDQMDALLDQVEARDIGPQEAARKLIQNFKIDR